MIDFISIFFLVLYLITISVLYIHISYYKRILKSNWKIVKKWVEKINIKNTVSILTGIWYLNET